jgi:two-component system response regulator RegA
MSGDSLLLVDDDDTLRSRLARAFVSRGLRIAQAANYDEAMDHLKLESPTKAVIDLKMPGPTGLKLLVDLKRVSPNTEVVILTGYGSIANAVEAMRGGAVNYVTKPADADQILEAFRSPGDHSRDSRGPEIQTPSLAEAEWNHIQQVLSDCDGNLTQAAGLLGIPRRTLQRKLKKMAP